MSYYDTQVLDALKECARSLKHIAEHGIDVHVKVSHALPVRIIENAIIRTDGKEDPNYDHTESN